MAVGITIKKDKFEDFKKAFTEYAESKNISEIVPVINIERKVELKDVSLENVKELQQLEPFGEQNKMPLFLIENLKNSFNKVIIRRKAFKNFIKNKITFL